MAPVSETLQVSGVRCERCVMRLGGALRRLDGIEAANANLMGEVSLTWDADLCALWQVPLKALPEVRDSSARFGETTLDNSLAAALPIVGVIGDSQAALFAQRCYKTGDAKVTFGTGSSILLNIGAKPRFSTRGVVTTLAWVHAGVPTSGDSIFVGETVAALPSGQGSISFGNKAWLDRPRPSGQGYTPTQAYPGNPADEAAVRAFVQGLAGGGAAPAAPAA